MDDQPLKEHVAMFEASFPRHELSLDDILAEEDKVAIRATAVPATLVETARKAIQNNIADSIKSALA